MWTSVRVTSIEGWRCEASSQTLSGAKSRAVCLLSEKKMSAGVYFRPPELYLRFQYILIVALGGVPLLNSKFNIPEAESSVLSTASFVDSWFSYLDYSHFIYSGNSQRSQPNTNPRLKTKIGTLHH
jgi:hypothetical protein